MGTHRTPEDILHELQHSKIRELAARGIWLAVFLSVVSNFALLGVYRTFFAEGSASPIDSFDPTVMLAMWWPIAILLIGFFCRPPFGVQSIGQGNAIGRSFLAFGLGAGTTILFCVLSLTPKPHPIQAFELPPMSSALTSTQPDPAVLFLADGLIVKAGEKMDQLVGRAPNDPKNAGIPVNERRRAPSMEAPGVSVSNILLGSYDANAIGRYQEEIRASRDELDRELASLKASHGPSYPSTLKMLFVIAFPAVAGIFAGAITLYEPRA